MPARVLGEHSRKSVMVAYLFSRWPGMQGLDDAMRIKVRYLFEIFASGLISVDQLCSICNKLHPEMADAAKLLVPCERCTVYDIVFGVNPMNEIHTATKRFSRCLRMRTSSASSCLPTHRTSCSHVIWAFLEFRKGGWEIFKFQTISRDRTNKL